MWFPGMKSLGTTGQQSLRDLPCLWSETLREWWLQIHRSGWPIARASASPSYNPVERKVSSGGSLTCSSVQFSSVQLLSRVQLFLTPLAVALQAFQSIPSSWSLLKLMSIESMMPPNHLIICCPLLLYLQSFPASRSFPMSQFFASNGQSISFSFSISLSNKYSGLISFRID